MLLDVFLFVILLCVPTVQTSPVYFGHVLQPGFTLPTVQQVGNFELVRETVVEIGRHDDSRTISTTVVLNVEEFVPQNRGLSLEDRIYDTGLQRAGVSTLPLSIINNNNICVGMYIESVYVCVCVWYFG